jgi:CRP/FNR family transcriptional regulator, cyclic AMP receptor protein
MAVFLNFLASHGYSRYKHYTTNKKGGSLKKIIMAMLAGLLIVAAVCTAADNPALSKALAQATLFAELSDTEREMLKFVARLRQARAGERIIQQGTKLGRMFIILDSPAEIKVNGNHIVTLTGQTLVGEIEFLDMLPASADVIVSQDTDLIELNHAALTGLMDKQPRIGYVLMRELARIAAQRLRAGNLK